MLLEHQWLESN